VEGDGNLPGTDRKAGDEHMMGKLRVIGLSVALSVAACGGGEEAGDGELAPSTEQTTETTTATDIPAEAAEFIPGPLGAAEVEPGEEIQIRSLNSISGDVAFLGTPNLRGAELAIADYGPVAGRNVSLGTSLDDLCSPDGGQAAAQIIVADPKVVGVIGTTCSAAAVAAAPLISSAGMVMIAPSNTSPALTSDLAGTPGSAYQPGYYRTSHNDLFQGTAVALFVRNELGYRRAAAIHDGDPYTQGLAEAFREAFEEMGGEVTAFTAVNKGDTDMIAVLTEVAAGNPEAVFFPIFMPEGGFIVQQVDSVSGLRDTKLIVSAALLVDNFMELPESEGVYISGPDLRFGSNANSITGRTADGLLAAYLEAYGERPSAGYWGHSYDATTMLLKAIEEVSVEVAETLYIDRQALRSELHASSFDGVIGPIACDEFGDCGSQLIAVIHHIDPRDIEAGKNNVVFDYAPTR